MGERENGGCETWGTVLAAVFETVGTPPDVMRTGAEFWFRVLRSGFWVLRLVIRDPKSSIPNPQFQTPNAPTNQRDNEPTQKRSNAKTIQRKNDPTQKRSNEKNDHLTDWREWDHWLGGA